MDKEIKFYVENDGTTVFTGYNFGKTQFKSISRYNDSIKAVVYELLKTYINFSILIKSDNSKVWIGSDFPGEYVSSNYTYKIKGQILQAKMSVILGIISIVENAKLIKNFQFEFAVPVGGSDVIFSTNILVSKA